MSEDFRSNVSPDGNAAGLDVVAENTAARMLYERVGFTEYGRNPRGFRTRSGAWQELILMRLELD